MPSGISEEASMTRYRALRHGWSILQILQLERQPLKASKVDRLLKEFDLPPRLQKAAYILYRQAMQVRVFRGDLKPGAIEAAAVFTACRHYEIPILIEDIEEHSIASRKDISQMFRWLSREMKLKIRPIASLDYLQRFCQKLDVSDSIKKTAEDILHQFDRKNIASNRSPTALAAAALYIASRQHSKTIWQKDIGEVAGVTDVTIRNTYKELVETLDMEI